MHACHGPRAHLGEFVAVLGFQVALHICHEFVQAQREVRLPVRRLRGHYPIPECCVDLRQQEQFHPFSWSSPDHLPMPGNNCCSQQE